MKRILLLGFLLAALAPVVILGQVGQAKGPVFVSDPVVPTITPAVKDLPGPIPGVVLYGQEMKRREEYGFVAPYYEGPQRLDPLASLQQFAGPPTVKAFGTPTLNIAGLNSGSSPPDDTGDVGPNHFLQGVNGTGSFGNSSIGIWSKAGANMKTFQMDSLASAAPCSTGYCDPIVLYDRLADRWVISEFPSSGGHLCVYVSTTPDPMGTWYEYQFLNVESGTPDYPKYGVWPQNGNGGMYLLGVNAGSSGRDIICLDRANMLAGTPATWQKFTVPTEPNFGFQLVLPAHMNGPVPPPNGSPAIVMRPRDDEAQDSASTPSYDLMEMWAVTVDWVTPANSAITQLTSLQIGDYDCSLCGLSGNWNCMPQPSGQGIDPIREPLHFPLVYRNFSDHETLVGCFVTDVDGTDHAALRWFEFRKSGASWSVYQEGVIGGESGVHRSVGSVTMDGSGNMAIGYTKVGPSIHPSIYYRGRLSTDPLGTMPQGEYVIQDATTDFSNERWGDYAGIGIDPADDCTFWFTTEYGGSGDTRIAALKFDACGYAGSVAFNKNIYPCSGTVTITVSDASLIGNTTQNVEIWSTRETTRETVVCTATPAGSATFIGTIALSNAAPVHGDGLLSIAAGNTITVEYIDADDGQGGVNVARQDTAAIDCTGPVISNVQVTNITGTTATVTWDTNEPANSLVTYGISTPPGTVKDNLTAYVTSHSISLTGLTVCSLHYFSVTSADVAGNSATDTNGGSYYTFTTPNSNQTVFSEDFSTITPTALPAGWTTVTVAGNTWNTNASGCTNNSLRYAYNSTAAADSYVFTPGIALTSGVTYTLGFNQKVYSASYPEKFEVKCGTAATAAGQTITIRPSASYTNTACQALSNTFTVPSSGTYYISFHCTSDADQYYLYIDDVNLSRPGSCTAELEYDSHSMTDVCSGTGAGSGNGILEPGENATLAITIENIGGSATGVSATLSSSTPGITVTDGTASFPNIGAGGTGTSIAPHFTISAAQGMTCVTTADFTLHTTSNENPSGTDSYFTVNVGQAGGAVSDFSENFTTITPPTLPAGWTTSSTSGNNWQSTNTYYCNAAGGLYYPYNSGAAANSWAYTPGIALSSGVTYTLNFNQKVQSATWPEIFEVKCGTAATPAGQTITILASATYTNTTCTLRSPTFTVPTTGTYYIGFHCTSAADMYYLIIDDINLTHTSSPLCNVCTPSGCAMTVDVTPNGTTAACTGANIVFTATRTGGTAPFTYQWTENGTDISGATNSTLTRSKAAAGTFTYNCKVDDSGGCTDVQDASASTGTWVAPPTSVTVTPSGTTTVCTGANIVFTATVAGGASPLYQWTENGSNISGATNSTYTASKAAAGSFTYTCTVNNTGCATTVTDSTPSTGTWVAPPAVDVTPNGTTTVCTGATITFTATRTGGTAPFTYQWTENGSNISGATNSTYAASKAGAGSFTYNCNVTSTGCATAGSDATASTGTWQVCAPNIVYQSSGPFTQITGDGDAYYEPGEKWSVQVTLTNSGSVPATNVTADLAGNGITLCNSPGTFGNIAVSGTASFTFEFVISTTFSPCGGAIGFDVANKACSELTPAGTDQLDVFSVNVGQPGPGSPTELVIQPSTADTYVNEQVPATNYGSATNMDAARRTTRNRRSLVQFDLSGIPAGATINSATLELYATAVPTTGQDLDVHHITGTWAETAVNWNTQPTFSAAADASIAGGTAAGWKVWTVTPVVQSWQAGTYTNYGLLVKCNLETLNTAYVYSFSSREAASNRPILRVNYTPATGGWDCSYTGTGTCSTCAMTVDVTPNGTTTASVGSAIIFTAARSGGTAPFTYQWTEDGSDISGATNSTLSRTYGTAQSHTYNCKISDGAGCSNISDASASTGSWQSITTPPEVGPGNTQANSQSWTDKTTQTWPVETTATLGYILYRGQLAGLPELLLNGASDSCTRATTPTANDNTASNLTEDPALLSPGDFYWYLVTGVSGGGEGTAGNATAGPRVLNTSGGC